MNGSTTEISDPAAPNDPPRKFTFDFSYWSHDGFEKNDEGYLQPTVPHYADQVRTFCQLSLKYADSLIGVCALVYNRAKPYCVTSVKYFIVIYQKSI